MKMSQETLHPNHLWQVLAVNSLGATVQAHLTTHVAVIRDPLWKESGQWARARKPKVGKTNK